MLSKLFVGLCQIKVSANKSQNIDLARNALKNAVQLGSQMVTLPECWNCPYSTACFPEYAEIVPNIGETPDDNISPSVAMLSHEAKSLGIWIIGGSVPETETVDNKERLYNTSVIINPNGDIVGKHRKMHLFDIDVPGRIRFKESDSLSPGNAATVVDTPWGGIGVGICYDIRFPELAMIMRSKGARLLFYPGAFNMVTGPAHWELLARARAVDNQLYVITCSPARDESASYVAWGHSSFVSPWGEVLKKADSGEEILCCELDLNKVEEMRQSIPCWSQKRSDIYSLQSTLS
jgi:omega-amidase